LIFLTLPASIVQKSARDVERTEAFRLNLANYDPLFVFLSLISNCCGGFGFDIWPRLRLEQPDSAHGNWRCHRNSIGHGRRQSRQLPL
jgi:hypothetical protein